VRPLDRENDFMNWNSPKLLTGFFIVLGLLLFTIVLYDLIGNGRINASAIFIGLVMFFFAQRANEKKKIG
jgi:hypothetical protein